VRAAGPRLRVLAGALALALPLCGCRRDSPPPPPAVVLCAGDSITAGGYPWYLKRRLDEAGQRFQVINAGEKGNTSGEYLGFLRRSRLLDRTNPRWVLLQLGTNDVRSDGDATFVRRFRENLEAILDQVVAHRNPDGSTPRVLLATIPPVPVEVAGHFDAASRARVEADINPAIREIAGRRGIPIVDNHRLFAARPELLPGIHPSEAGYRALANAWYEVLAPLLGAPERPAKAAR
jgi:lysophospholipase L1-like esterase